MERHSIFHVIERRRDPLFCTSFRCWLSMIFFIDWILPRVPPLALGKKQRGEKHFKHWAGPGSEWLLEKFLPLLKKISLSVHGAGGRRSISTSVFPPENPRSWSFFARHCFLCASNRIGGHFFASTHARGSNNDDSCFLFLLVSFDLKAQAPATLKRHFSSS